MLDSDRCWKLDLSEIEAVLINIAKDAGDMITSAKPVISESGTKLNSVDLVTETDRAVERMVSRTLQGKYPTFKFLGEETYKPGMRLTDAPTFVVDPIDGTTNFVHGFPYACISLGFAVDKEPVVGVVYNPFTKQMWKGTKGKGSFYCDGTGKKQKLPLKEPEPLRALSSALVAVEWGSDREGENWEAKLKTWANLGKTKEQGGAMIHSARCLGSAALNLCGVASGELDVYWEGGCWAWDVCAGWVILRESGGVIVDGNASGNWDIPVDHRKYLAIRGAPSGQKEIIEEFWGHIDGTMEYES